jgi:hypothetical protein
MFEFHSDCITVMMSNATPPRTCYKDRRVVLNPRLKRQHREEWISVNGRRRTEDFRERIAAGTLYPQHLVPAIRSREHMQRLRLAHEHMPLVHVDVAYIFRSDIDRLHERPRAHIMQVRVIHACAEEGRVCESVRAREGWEGELGPGSEMPARRMASMCRDRGEELVRPFLFRVWWRERRHLWLALDKVTSKTPDFLLAVEPVKHEISIFVLAVGVGAHVVLDRAKSFGNPFTKMIIDPNSPGEDSIEGHQKIGGSRRDRLTCAS